MEIISWEKVAEPDDKPLRDTFFENGCAVTVGSFDGPHIGHKNIFDKVILNAQKLRIPSVIVTFYDPLPAIKHSDNYLGDIATFLQRASSYAKIGFDYCVVVDFSFNFSKIKGRDFLDILESSLGVRYIAEGVDFHFGCNGSYHIDTIKDWAAEMGVATDFIDLVTCQKLGIDMISSTGSKIIDTGRVSSSYIRQCIKNGGIKMVNQLLVDPYKLDFSGLPEGALTENIYGYTCQKAYFTQVIPQIGTFDAEISCRDEDDNNFLLRGCLEVNADAISLVGLTGNKPSRIESVKFN